MSIVTKTGDDGTTALMYGRRVPKSSSRVAAYGAVDELNCALGMARALARDAQMKATVLAIQQELVTLMGDLAVAAEDQARYRAGGFGTTSVEMTERLEELIQDLEQGHQVGASSWVMPGESVASAAFDVARTACRRAERELVKLSEEVQGVEQESIRYLNRLSDLCWLFARLFDSFREPSPNWKADFSAATN